MTATCSGCKFNKVEKDSDIGVDINGCPSHGIHSPSTMACSDFKPIDFSENLNKQMTRPRLESVKPEKKTGPSSSSDLLGMTTPLIGYVVAIAVVLIIATVGFTTVSSMPISLADAVSSPGLMVLPQILVIVALLIGIAVAAEAAT